MDEMISKTDKTINKLNRSVVYSSSDKQYHPNPLTSPVDSRSSLASCQTLWKNHGFFRHPLD